MARENYRPVDKPKGAHKPKTFFTLERQEIFLQEYAKTGLVMHSAAVAGVYDGTIREHEKSDEEFAAKYQAAKRVFNEQIETEIKRRAIEGWQEPVYQKGMRVMEPVLDADGNIVKDSEGNMLLRPAFLTRYSDRMLELLAKRHMPEYRDKFEVSQKVSGGVLVIPAVAGRSEADWEKLYDGSQSPQIPESMPQVRVIDVTPDEPPVTRIEEDPAPTDKTRIKRSR